VGTADPFVACPELEPGEFWRTFHSVDGGEQRGNVNAVARQLLHGGSHSEYSFGECLSSHHRP